MWCRCQTLSVFLFLLVARDEGTEEKDGSQCATFLRVSLRAWAGARACR
jgi:hypothetical protein